MYVLQEGSLGDWPVSFDLKIFELIINRLKEGIRECLLVCILFCIFEFRHLPEGMSALPTVLDVVVLNAREISYSSLTEL